MREHKRVCCQFGLIVLAGVLCAAGRILPPATSAPPQPRVGKVKLVDFARDVLPILRRSCVECHGSEKDEGGLRLDLREPALESGTIEPGDPQASELLRRIRLPKGHDEVMPAIGDPLPRRDVAVIRRWIEQGAQWPEEVELARHWAYVTPTRPQLPEVPDSNWCRSPIDRFVLARLDDEGLLPSPRATPEKLVRRLFLDLIGLPPTPEEVQQFVAAPTDERLESLVDELLQRPQFGERWARPWLDLARYADSHGFQRDNLWDVWAYRDWVIRALNDDMPFDQFTIEQIAGDLLPDASESQKIATGFHRCVPTNVEAGSLPEETRSEQVLDRVNTTGAVWLGTTLECCQCHDHKYDPFTMKDYYRLLAYFNNTELEADRTNPKSPSSIQFQGPKMSLSDTERDARRKGLQSELAKLKEQQTNRRRELAGDLSDWAMEFSASLADSPRTHALEVVRFESQGTTDTHKILDDRSVLIEGGDPPAKDVYTATLAAPPLKDVRAIRLDALQHESLPGGGPGRGDPQRRNFVLNDFRVEIDGGDAQDNPQLNFTSASTSFSQNNWDVFGAVDDDPKSGWAIAPMFDDSHWAVFVLEERLTLTEDTKLQVTLAQQWGQSRTIGRFRVSAMTGNVEAESVPEQIAAAVERASGEWTKEDRTRLVDYRVEHDADSKRLAASIKKLEKQIAQVAPDTTLVMIELDQPRMTSIFERGDYRQQGERVAPGTPEMLPPAPEGLQNRLTLARWLVSQDNPLTPRVTVNRWWAELFGQGLVTTVEDFGIKGEPPTHPELLDWLAVEFVESGWSMKHILKSIVLSATYQQSSRITPGLLERDDQNRLLARGPRFRMDAEMIRDNALAISGLLDLKQFGPPIRPYQPPGIWSKVGGNAYDYQVSPGPEQHRRGIYVVIKRGSPYPSFVNFDATARLACTVKRSRTNTPLQALTLLNDPVYVEAARALATRVQSETAGESLDAQIANAFQLCTARSPTDAERAALLDLYHAQLNSDGGSGAAWQSVAATLLNLHETVTKD